MVLRTHQAGAKRKTPKTLSLRGFLSISKFEIEKLSLAELGSATGGFEAVLLAFLHSGVAGQETGGLQGSAVALIDQQQGAGDAVADGAGLAGNAAAGNGGLDVNLADGAGGDQGLTDDELQGIQTEVVVDITAVDGDRAGAVGDEVNAGNGGLSAAGAVHIGLLALIGCHISLPPLSGPKLRASGLHGCARRP